LQLQLTEGTAHIPV